MTVQIHVYRWQERDSNSVTLNLTLLGGQPYLKLLHGLNK